MPESAERQPTELKKGQHTLEQHVDILRLYMLLD